MLLGESVFSAYTFSDDPDAPAIQGAIAIDLYTQLTYAADLDVDQSIVVQLITQADH